ncbi:hypothetical protein F8388_024449 [Cannabis sativa]|uniref:Uncharacterized protein n=1 Tax=Cannabis sativa TaxID=3483 RepID=A0A7J6DUG1_CANSA|nr:hypothetical protein F8388_024449 [Cannabis sativa]
MNGGHQNGVRPLPDGFIDRESDLKKRKNNDRAYVEETAREPRSVDKWKMIVSICEELEILGGFTPGLSGDGNKEMKPHKGREERYPLKIKHLALSTEGAGAMLQKAQGEDIEGGEGRCNLFEKTGYAKLWEVDTVGLSGGLLLMWKDDLHVRVDSSSPCHIAVVMASKGFLPWNLTCFYGHLDASQHNFSWKLLRHINRETEGAWLSVGDFNEIVSLAKKSRGILRESDLTTGLSF